MPSSYNAFPVQLPAHLVPLLGLPELDICIDTLAWWDARSSRAQMALLDVRSSSTYGFCR